MSLKLLPMLLGTVLAFGVANATLAQDTDAAAPPAGTKSWHQPDPEHQAQRMTKMLNLTPDQSNKVAAILQQRQQQAAAIKADSSADPMAQRQKWRSLMQSSQQQIDAVLTDTQRQQMKDMREKMRQRHQEKKQADDPAQAPTAAQ